MLTRPALFVLSCLALLPAAAAQAAWEPVAPADLSKSRPTDFADRELDVPYHLHHFHRLANAVVESGPNRGFIDLKVNREPKDNEPHNARILENNLAIAYFYCADRPWNPYRGSPAVRARLEAVLDFWCKVQHDDGLFSEYGPTNWSLAPTGFGVMHMAQTLELLSAPGAPAIDRDTLDRTFAAQRMAVMAILASEKMLAHGREYSNQFSGVYRAALSYLRLRPDAELQRALEKATARAVAETQSPAGFMYEQGGPDFGYSQVHENNLRVAGPFLATTSLVSRLLLKEYDAWNRWLSYNLVLQPDGAGYFTNAGVNTRTSHSFQTARSLPLARDVGSARPFAMTDVERRAELARKRDALQATWPKMRDLTVPSAHAYNSAFAMSAIEDLDPWFPTDVERSDAVAKLPYLARDRFVHVAADKFPFVFTYVRHPSYYAAFNSGRIRIPGRQAYGLGLLWHPKLGTVLQSVAATEWTWGTRPDGDKAVLEMKDVNAALTVAGRAYQPKPGHADLPAAPVTATYDLPGGGRKSVSFTDAGITVTVDRPGAFAELLPLIKQREGTIEQSAGRLVLAAPAAVLEVTFPPAAAAKVGSAQPVTKERQDLSRVLVEIRARDRLEYRITFRPAAAAAGAK